MQGRHFSIKLEQCLEKNRRHIVVENITETQIKIDLCNSIWSTFLSEPPEGTTKFQLVITKDKSSKILYELISGGLISGRKFLFAKKTDRNSLSVRKFAFESVGQSRPPGMENVFIFTF